MRQRCAAVLVVLVLAPARASAYSVLAHEAAIDAAWDGAIAPLLRARFPRTTRAQLLEARAFAYGGSVIQDLGYYPFGSRFFSNLLHYVRSGDFVEALIRDARDVNELAFALGALAHYANDTTGHPEAVNRALPLEFPKLQRKLGDTITYVQAPAEHVIVEFSFDVVQAAGGAYLPEAYQRFIGFRVADDVLQRAFADTYGLEMRDVFADVGRSMATYRYAVSQIIPSLTDAAWRDRHDDIVRLHPSLQRSGFVFAYGRAAFEREYGRDYRRPGWFARVLGVVYRLVPKIGPLRPLSFKTPTVEAERLFAQSFRDARSRFVAAVRDARDGRLQLPNTNFDTGRAARHGEYALADDTYAELLKRLSARRASGVPPALRANLRAFYGDRPTPSRSSKADRRHWKDTVAALDGMR
jgi:hypothetical protein